MKFPLSLSESLFAVGILGVGAIFFESLSTEDTQQKRKMLEKAKNIRISSFENIWYAEYKLRHVYEDAVTSVNKLNQAKKYIQDGSLRDFYFLISQIKPVGARKFARLEELSPLTRFNLPVAPDYQLQFASMLSKANEELYKAKKFRDKADKFEADVSCLIGQFEAFKSNVDQYVDTLWGQNQLLNEMNDKIRKIIDAKGGSYSKYSLNERECFYSAYEIVKKVTVDLDIPLESLGITPNRTKVLLYKRDVSHC